MTDIIRLHRMVTVTTFETEATLAIGRDRPELLAVAQLAHDLNRPIFGADITEQLLARLPEHIGWRVIDRCLDLGLVTRQEHRGPVTLSDLGREAVRSGQVLIPEEGTWRIYTIADPLITTPLVHFARLDPPRADEERNPPKNAPNDQNRRPNAHPPPDLQACHRKLTIARSLTNGVPFQITDLPQQSQGTNGPRSELRLELTWTPGVPPTLRLRGALPRPEARDPNRQGKPSQREEHAIDATLPLPRPVAAVPFNELWFYLTSHAGKVPIAELHGWFQRTGKLTLPTAFDNLDRDARTALRRALPIPQVDLGPALGTFDATTLDGVDLVPRTAADADRWAQWFQREQLIDYATPTTLERTNKEILAKFPYHKPRLHRPQELLDAAFTSPREPQSRFLLASYDLGLWRPS